MTHNNTQNDILPRGGKSIAVIKSQWKNFTRIQCSPAHFTGDAPPLDYVTHTQLSLLSTSDISSLTDYDNYQLAHRR